MAGHNLGMAEMAGSLPEMVRQSAGAARREEVGVDAMTAHQVEARQATDAGADHRLATPRPSPGRSAVAAAVRL